LWRRHPEDDRADSDAGHAPRKALQGSPAQIGGEVANLRVKWSGEVDGDVARADPV
jgi:hypothetical protein